MKTALERWQLHRKWVAEARRGEADALKTVHQSFRTSAGPTNDEYWALKRAWNKTHRKETQLLKFVELNVRKNK
jgi:hypothetical protein